MYRRLLTAVSLLSACLLSPLALAAAGDLDTSFGGGQGWVSTGFGGNGGNADLAYSVIRQNDGKLVVVGSRAANGTNQDFVIARYELNGALDFGFGSSGRVITAIGTGSEEANSVIQQSDGKLVVAGFTQGASFWNFALVRYNQNGSLDTTFDNDGKVITAFGSTNANAQEIIQQSDGKLVAVGGNGNDFVIARYNSDGSLDTSFNGTGKVTTSVSPSGDVANSVIQQTDGKLVVAGRTYNGSNDDIAVVRYNADGSLDASFDGDGMLITTLGSGSEAANSIIVQTDGKLVVGGYANTGSKSDFALVRYNSNGSLDTSLNSTGKVTVAIGSFSDGANSVMQQADGKLVLAGNTSTGSYNDIALVRFNTNGTLDTTFDGDGKRTAFIGGYNDDARSIIQQPDGRLVTSGISQSCSAFACHDFSVLRFNSDGTLDTAFDGDGIVTTDFPASLDYARSIIQQSDGKLVAAGYSKIGSNLDVALARYNADGTLDTSFDSDGKVTTAVGAADDPAWSLIQQLDGKIVVAGYSNNGSNDDVLLVRYNGNGSLDTTFNTTGKVTTAVGTGRDTAYDVIQQSDGKLVAVGLSNNGSNDDFLVVRYNANGALDTSFNGTGKVVTPIGSAADVAWSVVQQPDGKLIVAGYTMGSNYDFAIVRYNINGSLDTTFNGSGKMVADIGGSADFGYSLALQSDGKYLMTGAISSASIGVARFNSNGTLDSSFNGTGKIITPVGITTSFAWSVIQQADGKVVVGGYSIVSGYDDFMIVRYNTNGSLDTTFNTTGILTKSTVNNNIDNAFSIIQQSDGKLTLAGFSTGMPTSQEFVVARFESGMCFAGKYWNGAVCVDADAGNYVSTIGATSQTACTVGTYQPLTGQTSCNTASTCTLGSTYETTAATLISDRVCSAVSSCIAGTTYEAAAPTLFADRVCTAYSVANCATFALTADACLSCQSGYVLSGSNCVLKATQTITVNTAAPASAAFGTTFPVAAAASSGLPVAITISGGCSIAAGTVTMTSASVNCTVNYDQAGDANYSAATQVSSSTTATQAVQTITIITPAPAQEVMGGVFGVAATASSGLPVTISTSGGCSNVGNSVTMISSSMACAVNYDQIGDANYSAAPQVINNTAAAVAYPVDGSRKGAAISGDMLKQ